MPYAGLPSALFGTRYAFVWGLGADRQASLGRDGPDIADVPDLAAFCARAAVGGMHGPLVVHDTQTDPAFLAGQFVTDEPRLRFYASVAISFDGSGNRATVCIADPAPRPSFGYEERERLRDLAVLIKAALDGRNARGETMRAQGQVLKK